MTQKNYMKLEFPARSVNEGFARAAVAAFAAQLDPTLAEIGDIKTAVSEAVTNCIVHAYPDEVGLIHITVVTDAAAGVIRVSVRDSGVGIPDIAQARTAMFTTGGAERSGMGFCVMQAFMDELTVSSEPGIGTTVTMTKTIGQDILE